MRETASVSFAAAGDIHCSESSAEQVARAFAPVDGEVDMILLAGDLTTHGEPAQAQALADGCRELRTPVFAVLGNHDWHANRADELTAILTEAGIKVLDRDHALLEVRGHEVGIVGVKGFVGGFPGGHLPDFGEPLLRQVYAETGADADALGRGLAAVAHCPFRIVLMHYSPVAATLEGEPREIWAFLGSDRLAAPIAEHEPDVVLHGHAHAGAPTGTIGPVCVRNVSVPVLGEAFWIGELRSAGVPVSPVH